MNGHDFCMKFTWGVWREAANRCDELREVMSDPRYFDTDEFVENQEFEAWGDHVQKWSCPKCAAFFVQVRLAGEYVPVKDTNGEFLLHWDKHYDS
jgi:hypothetical protein